jgi:hypothetical protein
VFPWALGSVGGYYPPLGFWVSSSRFNHVSFLPVDQRLVPVCSLVRFGLSMTGACSSSKETGFVVCRPRREYMSKTS